MVTFLLVNKTYVGKTFKRGTCALSRYVRTTLAGGIQVGGTGGRLRVTGRSGGGTFAGCFPDIDTTKANFVTSGKLVRVDLKPSVGVSVLGGKVTKKINTSLPLFANKRVIGKGRLTGIKIRIGHLRQGLSSGRMYLAARRCF